VDPGEERILERKDGVTPAGVPDAALLPEEHDLGVFGVAPLHAACDHRFPPVGERRCNVVDVPVSHPTEAEALAPLVAAFPAILVQKVAAALNSR